VVNSMIAAFIETPLSGEQIAELFGTPEKLNASRAAWEVKLEGASVIPLHPGDKLSAFTPSRPNDAFAPFVEAVLRYIGTGLNLPYELLMKDFSKTNYSSARAALLEAWRYFTGRREWLATYWASPVYELWLEEAVARGEVEAPGYYDRPGAYAACRWIGPGRGWIDPMKEAQASGERIRNYVSTYEREAAEQGLDWEEVAEQLAREQAFMQKLGLNVAAAPALPAPSPDGTDAGDDPAGHDDGETPEQTDEDTPP
jgi:lambda family phage portal protein